MCPTGVGEIPIPVVVKGKEMIRFNKIIDALRDVVGWEEPYDNPGDWTKGGDSGILFNDAHPLMTHDNIKAVMPDNFIMRYKEYVGGKSYRAGDVVRVGKVVYKAETDTDSSPTSGGDEWVLYDGIYTDYLGRLVDKGITQVIQRFTSDKKIAGESKSLLERRTFFDGAGRLAATTANRHKIVGMEIVPVRAMGVTTKIERIGFQGTGGTGIIKVYIFHTSKVDPVYTLELDYTNDKGGFQWFNLTDIYLPYIGEDTDSGGAWLVCYSQDELPRGLEAINVSKDWSREPCGTCNIGSLQTWREITKYLQISPFMYDAPLTFSEFPECLDVEYLTYTNTSNYGLNIEISVGCDLTDFICSQRMLFTDVIQKQVAYNALRTMAMNPDVRVNRNQSNVSRMDILYELDGNTQGRASGLGEELDKAYKALEVDTRGIDRVCLSCNNGGVRYRTV